jgi:hypothetical protein
MRGIGRTRPCVCQFHHFRTGTNCNGQGAIHYSKGILAPEERSRLSLDGQERGWVVSILVSGPKFALPE